MPRKKSTSKKPKQVTSHRDKWANIPTEWEKWCRTGKHRGPCKRNAVVRCLKDGIVRGYLSGFRLDPKCQPTDSMYPSVEHLTGKENREDVVVETRIVNDMKSHLTEKEFWQLIGHLSSVDVEGRKIGMPLASNRLPDDWRPERNFRRARCRR
jgi:hypothetical protein